MDMYLFLKRSAKTFLLVFLMALPIFFLPLTREYFDTNKWMLFVFIAIFVLFLWAGRLLVTGKADVSWSGTTIGLGLLTAAAFFSLTFSSFNKIEALLTPLGPLTWMAATIILFFGATLLSEREKILLRLGLVGLAGLAGLVSVYMQLGLGSLVFPAGSPYRDRFFTPLGTPVSLVTYLLLCLPISVSISLHALKGKKDWIAALSVVATVLTLCGIGITLVRYLPFTASQILPQTLGIPFTLSSWNSLPHLFFGVGPEKFFEVFTLFRPQSVNLSPIWNTGFQTNASLLLHISSTLGLVGLVSLGIFSLALWNEWKTHSVTGLQAILYLLLVFLAPPTLILVMLPVLFILSSDACHVVPGEIQGGMRYLIGFLVLSIALVSFYGLLRWHEGERLLFQSLQTARDGNGSRTFMLEEQAIQTNPTNPGFHMALAQTSLSLAQNLIQSASVEDNPTPALSDEDKTLLTNLVNRSIQEAKLTVVLSPTNVHAWVTLARVYQGLIGIAKDADSWAIASYQKAITFDPTNPVLRLDLGGLYVMLGRNEDAGKEFIAALTLKPNYVNGWYNLANAFRQMGDWDNAIKALEETKKLIPKGSTDEANIEKDMLSVLEEKKTKGPPQKPSSLVFPEFTVPN